MVHVTGDSATGQMLYLAHSTDGMHWNDLNGGAPVLNSTIGTKGVRDPALVRSPGGIKYWIVATDLCVRCGSTYTDGSPDFVVWESITPTPPACRQSGTRDFAALSRAAFGDRAGRQWRSRSRRGSVDGQVDHVRGQGRDGG
jgi:hypothetical protein